MEKHLKSKHPASFKEFEIQKAGSKRKDESEHDGTGSKQPKISNLLKSRGVVMPLCVGLVTESGRPLQMFEDGPMKGILKLGRKGAKEEDFVAINGLNVRAAIEEECAAVKATIYAEFKNKIVNFTADMATCQHRCFIGVNAQYFSDEEQQIVVRQLACLEVFDSHTGDNITEWLEEVQAEAKIHCKQILAVSVDSAANITKGVNTYIKLKKMGDEDVEVYENFNQDLTAPIDELIQDSENAFIAAMREADDEAEEEIEEFDSVHKIHPESAFRIHCAVHKAQLAVNYFMWREPSVSRVLVFAQKLAAKLRNQTVRKLLRQADLPFARLDQLTRWSSTYNMLQSLLKLEEFCKENSDTIPSLKVPDAKWKAFKAISAVLEPLAKLTTELQAENLFATDFVLKWKAMVLNLDKMKTTHSKLLLKYILIREKEIFANPLMKAVQYLDKRTNTLMTAEDKTKAKEVIRMVFAKKCELLKIPVDDEDVQEVQAVDDDDEPSGVSDEFNELNKLLEETEALENPTTLNDRLKVKRNLEKDFADYDRMTRLPLASSLVEFWNGKKQKDSLPLISFVAHDIIAVPVTEVSVERLFSHLNFILNKHRSSLAPDLLGMIMFLRMNSKLNLQQKKNAKL